MHCTVLSAGQNLCSFLVFLLYIVCTVCRRRIVVVARAIGRFEIQHIYQDKPFMLANVQTLHDAQPQTFQQAATTSTAAMQLWQCMQQVSDLASKLYEHAGPLGTAMSCTCTPMLWHLLPCMLHVRL